jgi:riboflavin kinase
MSTPVTEVDFWGIRGTVIHGHGRGGTMLGFPTANIELDAATIDRLVAINNDVCYGWAMVEDSEVPGASKAAAYGILPMVMSVGHNPHFKDRALSVEAHFIHKFDADFYGATIRVVSCGIVRKMGSFTTLDALIQEINQDCAIAIEKLTTVMAPWKECTFLTGPPAVATVPFLKVPLASPTPSSTI